MKYFEKPSADLADRVPPGQHLAKGFPVLTYGDTPTIGTDPNGTDPTGSNPWQLTISGMATPKTFSWQDFMDMPQSEFTADFHCVTTWSKLDVKWRGVRITDFLKHIDIEPGAAHVMQHCYGGYTTNTTLEDFAKEENFFAHTLFGEPLPAKHGGPMRVVIPHLYAWKSAKWISGIEFLAEMKLGFWERNGYHHRGEPFAQERYSDR